MSHWHNEKESLRWGDTYLVWMPSRSCDSSFVRAPMSVMVACAPGGSAFG